MSQQVQNVQHVAAKRAIEFGSSASSAVEPSSGGITVPFQGCVRIKTNEAVDDPQNQWQPEAGGYWWVVPGVAWGRHEKYVYFASGSAYQQYILVSQGNGIFPANTQLELAESDLVPITSLEPTGFKTFLTDPVHRRVNCDMIQDPNGDIGVPPSVQDSDLVIPNGGMGTVGGEPLESDFRIWEINVNTDSTPTAIPFYTLITGQRTGATARFIEFNGTGKIRYTEPRRAGRTKRFWFPGEVLAFDGFGYTRTVANPPEWTEIAAAPDL
jgi:hypothetical protein